MSEKVWIRATVEDMQETVEYTSIERDEWDAMTEAEQQEIVDQFGADVMNNCGGYGVGVIDESEVPVAELLEEM